MLTQDNTRMLHSLLFTQPAEQKTMTQLTADIQAYHLGKKPIIETKQELLERDIHHLDCIRAACDYQQWPSLQRAIHLYKYQDIQHLHVPLAKIMWDSYIQEIIENQEYQAVTMVPVPLHWWRRWMRGFNQAELMANQLNKFCIQLPIKPLLKRNKATGHQAQRRRAERLTAIQNAFVHTGLSVPSRIILIDDLATTGATLDACAQVLKNHGARWVEGWVIAHG